jgi:hypothetical protein
MNMNMNMTIQQLKSLLMIADDLPKKGEQSWHPKHYVHLFRDYALSSNGSTMLVIPHRMPVPEAVGVPLLDIQRFLKGFTKRSYYAPFEVIRKGDNLYALVSGREANEVSVVFEPYESKATLRTIVEENTKECATVVPMTQWFNWEYLSRMESAVALAADISDPDLVKTKIRYRVYGAGYNTRCVMEASVPEGTIYGVVLGMRPPKDQE